MNYYLAISHRKYFSLSFIPPSLKERVGVRPVVAYWLACEFFLGRPTKFFALVIGIYPFL